MSEAGREAFQSALKDCSGNGADLSKLIRERTLKLTSTILATALESAKREERRHTGVGDINGREILDGDIVKAATLSELDWEAL